MHDTRKQIQGVFEKRAASAREKYEMFVQMGPGYAKEAVYWLGRAQAFETAAANLNQSTKPL